MALNTARSSPTMPSDSMKAARRSKRYSALLAMPVSEHLLCVSLTHGSRAPSVEGESGTTRSQEKIARPTDRSRDSLMCGSRPAPILLAVGVRTLPPRSLCYRSCGETPCEKGGGGGTLYVPPKDEDLSTEARGGASRTPKPRADSAPKNIC